MAAICDKCGKGNMVGRRVTFSGKRNRRVFRANLHIAWVKEGNEFVKKKFCTKCLRVVKGKVTRKPKVPQVSQIAQASA